MPEAPPANLSAAILIGSLLHCTALALGVLRVPLAASYPQPAEDLAVHVLVCVQMVALAALAPLLLRNWLLTAVAVVMAWPYLLLAAFAAAMPWQAIVGAAGVLALWTVTLGAWQSVLRRDGLRGIGVAIALLLTLGGCVLAYLAGEYQPPITGGAAVAWWDHTPLLAGLRQLDQPGLDRPALMGLGVLLIAALALRWRLHRAQPSA